MASEVIGLLKCWGDEKGEDAVKNIGKVGGNGGT